MTTEEAFKRNKKFLLARDVDASGVSGTGIVAEGIEFTNGKCVISWLTATDSLGVYDSIKVLQTIHGHEGKTRIVYEEEGK